MHRLLSRRQLIGLLGTVAVPVLVACGGAPTTPPAQQAAPEPAKPAAPPAPAAAPAQKAPAAAKDVTIRAALFGTPAKIDGMKNVTERFQAANPGIKVEYIAVQAAEWDEYFGKITTLLASGQQLDLTDAATDGFQLCAGKEIIQPIDSFVQAEKSEMQEYFSDVAPALVEAMMYKGSLYQLPHSWGPTTIFYNTKLFREAGIEHPPDDWTKDDFLTAAKKVTALRPDTYGFALINRLWGGAIPWLFVSGGDLYPESKAPGGEWVWQTFYASDPNAKGRGGGLQYGEPVANSPQNVEALQFLVDLTHQHKAAPAPMPLDQVTQFFVSGKLGMLISARPMVGSAKNGGMGPDDFDITLMPRWKTQRHQFGVASLGLTKSSKSPEAAWSLMKWMARKDEMDMWVKGGVHTSPRRSVANDPKQHDGIGPKHWQSFYDAIDKRPDTSPTPAPVEAKEMTTTLVKYVGLAMSQDLKPQAALDQMQTELRALYARTKR